MKDKKAIFKLKNTTWDNEERELVKILREFVTCDGKSLEDLFTCDSGCGELYDLAQQIISARNKI